MIILLTQIKKIILNKPVEYMKNIEVKEHFLTLIDN